MNKNNSKQTTKKKKVKTSSGSKSRPTAARAAVAVPLAAQRKYARTYFKTAKGSREGSIRVQGRELLYKLASNADFVNLLDLSVNPLNQNLFPRLSSLATAFEQYTFRHGGGLLKLSYEAACSAATPGTVLMYHDYDANSSSNIDPIDVLNNQTSVEAAIWNNCSLQSDTRKQFSTELFMTTPLDSISVSDVRQTYFGALRVYTSDGATTSVFGGYLYVEYDIELITPKPPFPYGNTSSGPAATVAPSGLYIPPRPDNGRSAGMHAPTPYKYTSAYTNAGGKKGKPDWAKTILDTGQWALSAYANWTAAASSLEGGYVTLGDNHLSDETKTESNLGFKVIDRKEAKKMVKQSILDCKNRRSLKSGDMVSSGETETYSVVFRKGVLPDSKTSPMLSSGDIVYWCVPYDVTDGVIDPDFPVTANGMTAVADQTQSFTATGTGAYTNLGFSFDPIEVPPGHAYIPRMYCALGPTTGRTTSGLSVSLSNVT